MDFCSQIGMSSDLSKQFTGPELEIIQIIMKHKSQSLVFNIPSLRMINSSVPYLGMLLTGSGEQLSCPETQNNPID